MERLPFLDENNTVRLVLIGDRNTVVSPEGFTLGPPSGEIGFRWNGSSYEEVPKQVNLSMEDYENAINNLLDETAQAKQYTSRSSIVEYALSTNSTWKNEALAFISWKDAVLLSAYNTLEQVQSGSIQQPSLQEFVSALPTITWPE